MALIFLQAKKPGSPRTIHGFAHTRPGLSHPWWQVPAPQTHYTQLSISDTPILPPIAEDENQLILERHEKLKAVRQQQATGGPVNFPNDFKPTHHAEELFASYDALPTETLTEMAVSANVAGRMMTLPLNRVALSL